MTRSQEYLLYRYRFSSAPPDRRHQNTPCQRHSSVSSLLSAFPLSSPSNPGFYSRPEKKEFAFGGFEIMGSFLEDALGHHVVDALGGIAGTLTHLFDGDVVFRL